MDELAGNASYVNFQTGIEDAAGDVIALRAGCWGESDEHGIADNTNGQRYRTWFCGEHVAPFEESGTVAGAYLSGQEAASRVIQSFA